MIASKTVREKHVDHKGELLCQSLPPTPCYLTSYTSWLPAAHGRTADKLLQTKLREREVKEVFKQQRQQQKHEKAEVRRFGWAVINSAAINLS